MFGGKGSVGETRLIGQTFKHLTIRNHSRNLLLPILQILMIIFHSMMSKMSMKTDTIQLLSDLILAVDIMNIYSQKQRVIIEETMLTKYV